LRPAGFFSREVLVARPIDIPCIHDASARLERALIDDYLLTRGHDPDALWVNRAPQARRATTAASPLADLGSHAHSAREIKRDS
jgi:hypothetical protein